MKQPTRSATDGSLGARMARAVGGKDASTLRALFATPVVFRAVTPRRFWDAETAVDVVDIVRGPCFRPDRTVPEITLLEPDVVGDVQKVSSRRRVPQPSGPATIEQVAYYTEQDGRVTA